MPINMACPSCGQTLTVPETAAGKRAKCPVCEQVMIVPVAPLIEEFSTPLPSSMPATEQFYQGSTMQPQAGSGSSDAEQRRPCPACGEMIIVSAAKCRFCGTIFDPRLRGRGYGAQYIHNGPRGEQARRIRRCFTLWWSCSAFGVVAFVGGFVLAVAAREPALLIVAAFGAFTIISGAIAYLVLLYRLWATVQDGRAQTTPGNAVALLFVPCFNVYWRFVAIWGLSKELNRISREYRIGAPPVNEGHALTECILFSCGIIPYLGALPALAGFVISIFVLKNMCDVAVAIVDRPIA